GTQVLHALGRLGHRARPVFRALSRQRADRRRHRADARIALSNCQLELGVFVGRRVAGTRQAWHGLDSQLLVVRCAAGVWFGRSRTARGCGVKPIRLWPPVLPPALGSPAVAQTCAWPALLWA